MTLIVSWVATDDKPEGKKISSVYFCADSRISWTAYGKVYDMGKKVYACKDYPEIFCFCGDVDFPTGTLQSLIAEIDNGLLFDANSPFDQKKAMIADFVRQSLQQYPKDVLRQTFKIYYASCIGNSFYMAKFAYDGNDYLVEDVDLPAQSTKVFSDGSGKELFETLWGEADRDCVNEQNTSRNVYNCFSHTIDEASKYPKDRNLCMVGGAPQLVGLYRKSGTKLFGIVKNGERYIQGRRVDFNPCLNNIEWRNDNFERVNPQTMELLNGAQPQPFAPREWRVSKP